MCNEWLGFIGAVVGALIAGGALFWADFLKERRSTKRKLSLFLSAMKYDLENSIAIYEKIQEDSRRLAEKQNGMVFCFT